MSIIKHVTLQKIVAHDFRYDPRIFQTNVQSIFISPIRATCPAQPTCLNTHNANVTMYVTDVLSKT